MIYWLGGGRKSIGGFSGILRVSKLGQDAESREPQTFVNHPDNQSALKITTDLKKKKKNQPPWVLKEFRGRDSSHLAVAQKDKHWDELFGVRP